MSVVRIHCADAPSCPGLTSSRPTWSGPSGAPSSSTTRSCAPGLARPTLPRLAAPVLLVVGQGPAGHTTAEFGCSIGGQNGNTVLLGESVGIVGRQRRGAAGDGADAGQVGARQVGVQHRPQCGGHQRYRAGPVLAHRLQPSVELEAFQQHEGSRLGDTLQHPEHAADVHQRRVDDRDAASQLGEAPAHGAESGPITLRASMS